MIKVNQLTKHYGQTKVLKGVSFQVNENEIFGLLGPNGAGKTTTLECIEGLRSFDGGTIKIASLDPNQAIREKLMGIQLQSSSLPANISAKDAMTLFCKWNKSEPRFDLLKTFGFDGMLHKPYKSMSTGQKRRLHLALALAHNPKVIILDEPTAGLDVEARVALHQQLRQLKEQGITMILASHDMSEVYDLCDRIAILVDGEIKKVGTPDEIILEVERETIIKAKIDGEIDSQHWKHLNPMPQKNGYIQFKCDDLTQTLETLLATIKEHHCKLIDLSVNKPTLEERFIEIARKDV